ncbi:Hypothetical predicted protein [Octopus vulgaris]|uniref:Fanconi anemia group A protein n=1 Tax=Octopus vulgaris TaxID=6645 RepID=A0AA36EZW6_OCTVU|nr:Hypothetical predicted protein [Octopus vulgaris]
MASSCETLQNSTCKMISYHQNVNFPFAQVTQINVSGDSKTTLPVDACMEWLHNEVARSGQPFNLVAANYCGSVIMQLSKEETSSDYEDILQDKAHVSLQVIIDVILSLKEQQFEMDFFHKYISATNSDLCLEIIWKLHCTNILTFGTYLHLKVDKSYQCQLIADRILKLCISNISGILINQSFPVTSTCQQTSILQQDSLNIFTLITQGFATRDTDSPIPLLPIELASKYHQIHLDSLQKMAVHQLNVLFRFKPDYTVSDAVKHQEQWTYSKLTPFRRAFFKQFFAVLDANAVLNVIQSLLEADDFNWCTLLSFTSTFLICFQTAPRLLKSFVNAMLKQGLENLEIESSISALLFARQACFEGPHVFPSYPDWVELTFGCSNKSIANTQKSFTFLIKLLSDLVPFESAIHLKAHLMKTPFVPAQCSEVYFEYTTLVKTRLIDLKQSIFKSSVSSDYHSTAEKNQTSEDTENDVTAAVDSFATLDKIPANILQTIIFRRPYFVGEFLPALLKPRKLPKIADSRMKFIKALKDSKKLPASHYQNYIAACQQLMMTSVNVSETISLISETLKNLLDEPQSELLLTENKWLMTLDVVKPSLENKHVQVANTILNSTSKTLLLSNYAVDYDSSWLCQLFDVLAANLPLLPAIFQCLWRWTVLQWNLMSAEQILGLGAILCHLTLCHDRLPQVQILNCPVLGETIGKFTDLLWTVLPCSTSQQAKFLLQISTVFLKTFFYATSDVNKMSLIPTSLITKFTYLCERKYPYLRFNVCPSKIPNEEVVLYHCEAFTTIKNCHQIKLRQWVRQELAVDPGRDYLTNRQRNFYQTWFLHKYQAENKNGRKICSDIFNCLLEADTDCVQTDSSQCTMCKTSAAPPQLTLNNNKYEILTLLKRNIEQFLDIDQNNGNAGTSVLPWLLQELQESAPTNVAANFCKTKFQVFSKVNLLLNLPANLLFSDSRNTINEGFTLDRDVVYHIFQGIVMLRQTISDDLFQRLLTECPLLWTSLMVHGKNWKFYHLLIEQKNLQTIINCILKFQMSDEWETFRPLDAETPLVLLQAVAAALASLVLQRNITWTEPMLTIFGVKVFSIAFIYLLSTAAQHLLNFAYQNPLLLESLGNILVQFPFLLQSLHNDSLLTSDLITNVILDNSKTFISVVFFQIVMATSLEHTITSVFCDETNLSILLQMHLKLTDFFKQCHLLEATPSVKKHCSHGETFLTMQEVLKIGSFVKKIITMVPVDILQSTDSEIWQRIDPDIQQVYKETVMTMAGTYKLQICTNKSLKN